MPRTAYSSIASCLKAALTMGPPECVKALLMTKGVAERRSKDLTWVLANIEGGVIGQMLEWWASTHYVLANYFRDSCLEFVVYLVGHLIYIYM